MGRGGDRRATVCALWGRAWAAASRSWQESSPRAWPGPMPSPGWLRLSSPAASSAAQPPRSGTPPGGARLPASQASPGPTGPTATPSVKVPLTRTVCVCAALPRRAHAQAPIWAAPCRGSRNTGCPRTRAIASRGPSTAWYSISSDAKSARRGEMAKPSIQRWLPRSPTQPPSRATTSPRCWIWAAISASPGGSACWPFGGGGAAVTGVAGTPSTSFVTCRRGGWVAPAALIDRHQHLRRSLADADQRRSVERAEPAIVPKACDAHRLAGRARGQRQSRARQPRQRIGRGWSQGSGRRSIPRHPTASGAPTLAAPSPSRTGAGLPRTFGRLCFAVGVAVKRQDLASGAMAQSSPLRVRRAPRRPAAANR